MELAASEELLMIGQNPQPVEAVPLIISSRRPKCATLLAPSRRG